MKNSLQQILDYASLGYEISFTQIFGKDAILMRKRYSHPANKPLVCEQMFNHGDARNNHKLHLVLEFMYRDIQKQEETGKYSERLSK
jgi:hypothetical protein